MTHWLYLHLRAIAHAVRRLAGQPLGTLLSALVVGIALSVLVAATVCATLNGVHY